MIPFSFCHDPPCDQIHFWFGSGEIQILAAIEQWRTCRTDMHLSCPIIIKSFTKLCTTNDGIINHQQAFPFDQLMYRDQFHPGDQITLALLSRHKRTGPGWCIFNKWSCKRHSGTIGISNGMGNTWIRHTCYNIRWNLPCISACQNVSAFVPHFFYIDSFIGRSWIPIIYPEERADAHFIPWLLQHFHPFRCKEIYLARA